MAKTTFRNPIRVGSDVSDTLGDVVLVQIGSFTATSTSADTGIKLPQGARPLSIVAYGGATGGSNPTVDIGTATSLAVYANEVDADATHAAAFAVLNTTAVAADTAIYGRVGASAATGGTFTFALNYLIDSNSTKGNGAE